MIKVDMSQIEMCSTSCPEVMGAGIPETEVYVLCETHACWWVGVEGSEPEGDAMKWWPATTVPDVVRHAAGLG